jgi:hypothetical protein
MQAAFVIALWAVTPAIRDPLPLPDVVGVPRESFREVNEVARQFYATRIDRI